MEGAGSSETLPSIYWTIWCYIPEGHDPNFHWSENFTPQTDNVWADGDNENIWW
jgi:hypothetical protein